MDRNTLHYHIRSSYVISQSSSVQLTSRLFWFQLRSVVEYEARFQNTTVVRSPTGLRHYSGKRRSSAGIEFTHNISSFFKLGSIRFFPRADVAIRGFAISFWTAMSVTLNSSAFF
jgi:hypothetical protein